MKKWLSILLAAMMLLSMTALAEATEATEGAGVTETEGTAEGSADSAQELLANVHYNIELGYMISYSAGEFAYELKYGHDSFTAVEDEAASMLITGTEVQAEAVDSLLMESVGGYGEDAVIGEPTEKMFEGELTGHSGVAVKSIEAQVEGVTNRFYLVYKPTAEADVQIDVLCITATFPSDKAETYSAKFDALVNSIILSIPEAQYQGEGWQLWYPSEIVKPQEIYGKDGFVAVDEAKTDVSMIITLSDVAPELVPDLLAEAMGGYEGYYAASEQTEKVTDNSMVVRWFEVEQEGKIDRYYAVWPLELGDDVYCITASFPVADAELYGAAFDSMVNSFILNEIFAD